ncbi:MAG: hypothetical protein Q9168_007091 [Polycauliona sp. 1 TL-2023]
MLVNQTITQPYAGCNFEAFTAVNSGYPGPSTSLNLTISRSLQHMSNANYDQKTLRVTCTASRALHVVHIAYNGASRIISHTAEYISSLDAMLQADAYDIHLVHDCRKDRPACSNPGVRDRLTAFNHYALIDALSIALNGTYTMTEHEGFQDNSMGSSSPIQCGVKEGTIVGDTLLNIQRDNVTRTPMEGPEFIITEQALNDALFNLSLSAALQLGFWTDTVVANVTNQVNIYSFASPMQLLAPYCVCLILSFPFLYLGLRSLRLNGVSATQGGFVQIMMTTMGSRRLEEAVAGGCVGGENNVSKELGNLKVRFGELAGKEGKGIRAGFGTEEEVSLLRPDVDYGGGDA